MKSILCFLFGIVLSFFQPLSAQWSSDPANPQLVCDQAGHQNNVRSLPDGAGGAFVFWLDTRDNPGYPAKKIYGQHYNDAGYEMWEENGRVLMSHYNSIIDFNILLNTDGSMILGMITQGASSGAGDTLRFQMLTEAGESGWDQELVVGNAAYEPNAILYLTNFMLMPVDDEYYVFLGITYFGGSNGNRFTRFDNQGNLLGAYDGVPVGYQGYVGATGCAPTYDGSGDFYLYYATGNGSGAALHAFRFNSSGNQLWGPVNVTEGTSGLSYQLGGVSDENGITFVWEGSSNGSINLHSRRLTPTGAFDWNGNTVMICGADGSQSNFNMKRKDNYIYVTWADGRTGTDPGYYDIFAQRMDTTGYLIWQPDGIQVASFNTYIPYPMLEILDDYSIVVNHQSTVAGFMAQMVDAAGTLPWGPEARQISTTAFNPFYQLHKVFQSEENIIVVWNKAASGGGSDGVYISNLSLFTGIDETAKQESFDIYPNPANDVLQISIPEDYEKAVFSIYDANGQVVFTEEFNVKANMPLTIGTSGFSPGIYFMRLVSDQGTSVRKAILK